MELGPGDTLHSEPVLLKADGATRVGQHIALCPGQPIFFSPKRRHATQPWSSGPRLVLAAFSPSTVYKLKESQLSRLVQLGFSPPGFGSPAVAVQAEQSSISICNDQQPQVSQPSAGSSSASCASAMPVTSRSKQTAADSSKEWAQTGALPTCTGFAVDCIPEKCALGLQTAGGLIDLPKRLRTQIVSIGTRHHRSRHAAAPEA